MLFRVFGVLVIVLLCAILLLGLRAGRIRTEHKVIAQVEKALLCYYLDYGVFPAFDGASESLAKHKGNTYFAELTRRWPHRRGLTDHWGRPLRILPGKHNPKLVDIYSVGSNGRDEQGCGDDIKNWLDSPAE